MANAYDIVNGNREDNPSQNTTYVFSPTMDLRAFTLGGFSDGDTVAIDASSSDFKVKLKKNVLTLIGQKNTPSSGVVVKVHLDNSDGGSVNLAFLDGTVEAEFMPKLPGSYKGSWNFGGITQKKSFNLGSEKISFDIDPAKTYQDAYIAADRVVNAGTFVLTQATDNLTGSSGNDLFIGIAGMDQDNPNPTADGSDFIDGGEGRDTLKLSFNEADDDPYMLPTTVGVEVLEFAATYADRWNISGMQGLEEIRLVNSVTGSSRDTEFVGLTSIVDVAIVNANQRVNLNYADGVMSGGSDEMTLTLNGAVKSAGTDADLEVNVDDDNERLEILNVVSTGARANEIDLLVEGGVRELNISGNADLKIDTIESFSSIRTISATGSFDLTMKLNLSSDREEFDFSGTNGANVITIGEDSAYDAVNDGVEMNISAGNSSEDVLVISTDNDVSEDVVDIYSGFETLRVIDFASYYGEDAYDLTHLTSDFESLELQYDQNGNYNSNAYVEVLVSSNVADAISLIEADYNADSGIDLRISLENAVGPQDSIDISLVNTDSNENDDTAYFGEDLIIDDVESITLNSIGDTEDFNGNEQYNAFQFLYFDDAEELNIGGNVSFEVSGEIFAWDLELIDATGFTGRSLDLGEINSEDDLEYRGSMTADQTLNIDAYDDIRVTTGIGNDDITIDSDGNGDGGWNSAVLDVGGGDDIVRFDMNNNVGPNIIAYVSLGEGDDVLDLFDVFDDGNSDATFVVEVSDFDVANDLIAIDTDENQIAFKIATVQDGEYDVSDQVNGDTQTAVIEFAFEADNNNINFGNLYANFELDGGDLLEAIDFDLSGTGITIDNYSSGYLIAYNGGDAYLFTFDDGDEFGEDGTVDASEIELIAVLRDVAVGGLSAGNFADGGIW